MDAIKLRAYKQIFLVTLGFFSAKNEFLFKGIFFSSPHNHLNCLVTKTTIHRQLHKSDVIHAGSEIAELNKGLFESHLLQAIDILFIVAIALKARWNAIY